MPKSQGIFESLTTVFEDLILPAFSRISDIHAGMK
jgi:hypothetical protein